MTRKTSYHTLAVLASIACQSATVHCQTPSQAETFVRQMYSKYETKSAEDRGPDFTGRQAPAVFSPSLINLIHRDQRRTPRAYVGKLDYDPICSCQDFDGLQLTEVRIVKDAPDLAIAFVTLNFARDFPKPSYRPLKLHLIWLPQGWRIDDIETKDTPSLRKYLH